MMYVAILCVDICTAAAAAATAWALPPGHHSQAASSLVSPKQLQQQQQQYCCKQLAGAVVALKWCQQASTCNPHIATSILPQPRSQGVGSRCLQLASPRVHPRKRKWIHLCSLSDTRVALRVHCRQVQWRRNPRGQQVCFGEFQGARPLQDAVPRMRCMLHSTGRTRLKLGPGCSAVWALCICCCHCCMSSEAGGLV
jgi:hypothetical protein